MNPENPEILSFTKLRKKEAFMRKAGMLLTEHIDKQYAVLYFDIQSFMTMNEFCGRQQCDELLLFIAECFAKYENPYSIASHFGADIFVLLFCYEEIQELVKIVEDISVRVISYPLPCRILPSFGISITDKVRSPEQLCDHAKMALETIKGSSCSSYAFYDYEYHQSIILEKEIENKMERALNEGEFHVYLQPKVDILSRKIIGAEALVRWFEPEKGIIVPSYFIPIFEKDGFIIKLDTFMWEEVFKMLKKWKDNGWDLIPISVNVSRMHTYNHDFIASLCRLSEKYHISPKYVKLELTESVLEEDQEIMFQKMCLLREKGFLFSMDDYGTGSSSMNMLIKQPVDEIKIDKVFIDDINSKKNRVILKHTANMIKELDVNMIAEGVETQEQADYLYLCGCNKAQGYYYYSPMPIPEFENLLFAGQEEYILLASVE